MQIDFHFSVIYILARLAGFSPEDASIIAYSSQYVDDVKSDTPVHFDNGAIYKPICSSHKFLDYKNFDELANHLVWIPFHFLPGNCMLPAGEGEDQNFVKRVVCRQNSPVARDMVNECIRQYKKPNALHRLGITLHVYADTWAHKGFAGIRNPVNEVRYLQDDEVSKSLLSRVSNYFMDIFDREFSRFIDGVIPLGHGAVISFPDKPFLKWRYIDSTGTLIERDNPKEFLEAIRNIFAVMKRFRRGDPDAAVEGLDGEMEQKLLRLMESIEHENGSARSSIWLNKIAQNKFGFGAENPVYRSDGPGSWKYDALDGVEPGPGRFLTYTSHFEESNWKRFHDALQDHHYFLTRVLFPRYKLCIT